MRRDCRRAGGGGLRPVWKRDRLMTNLIVLLVIILVFLHTRWLRHRTGRVDGGELLRLEQLDNIFSEIDYSLYRPAP